MKTSDIFRVSFFSSLAFSIFGAFFKIMHIGIADIFLAIGVIATLVYIITAIYEVRQSTRIDGREKIMWTMAFIFFNGITGLVYFFAGRKRIV